MTKRWGTTLEFTVSLPSAPGQGQVISWEQSAARALSSADKAKWKIGHCKVEATENTGTYKISFPIVKAGQRRFDPETAKQYSDTIADRMLGRLPGFKRFGVSISNDKEGDDDKKVFTIEELLEFPDNIESHFQHIYERDIQIKQVLKAIQLTRDTNGKVRPHVLLHGPKGVGKTEIGITIGNIFGDIAVKRLDATSLTKAGAEKLLLDADTVPPVIVIEEIEKTTEANLPWLLAVLDSRGEIIKTTSRMNVSRLTRCLCIATANDVGKLKTFHDGALYDRFSLPIYCPLASEALLRRILMRDLAELPNGKKEWVDAALDYALHVEKTVQIRRVKAIMAIGGDRLLDGSFAAEQAQLRNSEQSDLERLSEFSA